MLTLIPFGWHCKQSLATDSAQSSLTHLANATASTKRVLPDNHLRSLCSIASNWAENMVSTISKSQEGTWRMRGCNRSALIRNLTFTASNPKGRISTKTCQPATATYTATATPIYTFNVETTCIQQSLPIYDQNEYREMLCVLSVPLPTIWGQTCNWRCPGWGRQENVERHYKQNCWQEERDWREGIKNNVWPRTYKGILPNGVVGPARQSPSSHGLVILRPTERLL